MRYMEDGYLGNLKLWSTTTNLSHIVWTNILSRLRTGQCNDDDILTHKTKYDGQCVEICHTKIDMNVTKSCAYSTFFHMYCSRTMKINILQNVKNITAGCIAHASLDINKGICAQGLHAVQCWD